MQRTAPLKLNVELNRCAWLVLGSSGGVSLVVRFCPVDVSWDFRWGAGSCGSGRNDDSDLRFRFESAAMRSTTFPGSAGAVLPTDALHGIGRTDTDRAARAAGASDARHCDRHPVLRCPLLAR